MCTADAYRGLLAAEHNNIAGKRFDAINWIRRLRGGRRRASWVVVVYTVQQRRGVTSRRLTVAPSHADVDMQTVDNDHDKQQSLVREIVVDIVTFAGFVIGGVMHAK